MVWQLENKLWWWSRNVNSAPVLVLPLYLCVTLGTFLNFPGISIWGLEIPKLLKPYVFLNPAVSDNGSKSSCEVVPGSLKANGPHCLLRGKEGVYISPVVILPNVLAFSCFQPNYGSHQAASTIGCSVPWLDFAKISLESNVCSF